MNIVLQRRPSVGGATIGELTVDGVRICFSLEDEIREVDGQPVSEWKIKGQTAIPAGRYRITLENSPRFGPDTLTVHDVPGFVGVRMHAGNKHEDTEGCPLLGFQVAYSTIVGGTSKPAVEAVKAMVRGAMMDGEEVWMEVCNPTAVA